ncbi:hypothetical protein GJ700_02530 [Duganella sp. FT92W]|uniref:Uncharacterized protein n=1 Tax=Pseudoduganella rivuli TaxID=2666085 RepID=A0A7X2IIS0_9BURK|nr:hypothetical protein [Pseudoduganella rivuli]MRV70595.1 hypothetical protein [Pseudoduganella rivuli]
MAIAVWPAVASPECVPEKVLFAASWASDLDFVQAEIESGPRSMAANRLLMVALLNAAWLLVQTNPRAGNDCDGRILDAISMEAAPDSGFRLGRISAKVKAA